MRYEFIIKGSLSDDVMAALPELSSTPYPTGGTVLFGPVQDEADVATLILGCTHYPLLKTMIGEFMGREVTLVDPAKTAAHHLERLLSERGLRADHPSGQAHFYVSDVPDSFAQTADIFLGEYKGGAIDQIAIDKY